MSYPRYYGFWFPTWLNARGDLIFVPFCDLESHHE